MNGRAVSLWNYLNAKAAEIQLNRESESQYRPDEDFALRTQRAAHANNAAPTANEIDLGIR